MGIGLHVIMAWGLWLAYITKTKVKMGELSENAGALAYSSGMFLLTEVVRTRLQFVPSTVGPL